MKIAVAADHNGYDLKNFIFNLMNDAGHEVTDVGPHEVDPLDDYPDYANELARRISLDNSKKGVLICGTGVPSLDKIIFTFSGIFISLTRSASKGSYF